MAEKEFKIKTNKYGMCEVFVENGGEVPKKLKQLFTSPKEAKVAINSYLRTRRDYPARGRKKSNATESEEGSV